MGAPLLAAGHLTAQCAHVRRTAASPSLGPPALRWTRYAALRLPGRVAPGRAGPGRGSRDELSGITAGALQLSFISLRSDRCAAARRDAAMPDFFPLLSLPLFFPGFPAAGPAIFCHDSPPRPARCAAEPGEAVTRSGDRSATPRPAPPRPMGGPDAGVAGPVTTSSTSPGFWHSHVSQGIYLSTYVVLPKSWGCRGVARKVGNPGAACTLRCGLA